MGNTGASQGQHLHFELHKGLWNTSKSNAVDPLKYLGSTPEEEDWSIKGTGEPSDNNYYRVMTGLFNNLESYENALNNYKSKYPYVIYTATDKPELVENGNWNLRFYTGRIQGRNNAEVFKKTLEERFT